MSTTQSTTTRPPDTNPPVIDAAYVWQVASDWRARREFDSATIGSGERQFRVTLMSGHAGPLHAAVRMLGSEFEIRTHPYRGEVIVAIHATYRAVPMCIHTVVPPDTVDALIESLQATAQGGER